MQPFATISVCLAFSALGQTVEIVEAPVVTMPGRVDSNSPAFWSQGQLHLLNSTGGNDPLLSFGSDQFNLDQSQFAPIRRRTPSPAWIEAVAVDTEGAIFAWYHQEQEWLCGAHRPSQPRIGAAVSFDGGRSFNDLGVILSSPDPIDCSSKNGYFTGGHGDFSVVLDRQGLYYYFLFGNYGGPLDSQGVAIARMAYQDRFNPLNRVWKYHNGEWDQPGVGGRMTPIFPARTTWQQAETDSFWGPSVHWNTHLEKYVVLLNRSCCSSGFPQEGIYLSFNSDISDPLGWAEPRKILDHTGWYPQVLGLGPGETDSLAGERARLYIYGQSQWEIIFSHEVPIPEDPAPPEETVPAPVEVEPQRRPRR